MTTYYHALNGSRFANSNRVDQSGSDDNPVIDWPLDDFIVACHFYNEDTGKNPASTTISLEWRNKTDAGSWTTLSGTGELTWSADTVLVNDTALGSGNWICSVLGAGYADTDGIEREGANDYTLDLGPDEETEVQWAIDASGADGGDEYEFRVYDSNRGTYMTVVPTITMATSVSSSSSESISSTSSESSQSSSSESSQSSSSESSPSSSSESSQGSSSESSQSSSSESSQSSSSESSQSSSSESSQSSSSESSQSSSSDSIIAEVEDIVVESSVSSSSESSSQDSASSTSSDSSDSSSSESSSESKSDSSSSSSSESSQSSSSESSQSSSSESSLSSSSESS
jgi:hypothetical protein